MAKGQAQELPAGRLASFEEEDSTDFASILAPRNRREQGPAASAAAPQVEEAAPAQKRAGNAPADPEPAAQAAGEGEVPAYSERANEIKSSSVHIPTPLLEKLVAFRDEHGMSNGQVVIAAIEKAHPKLPQLIHPVTAGGGGLFAQRATRGVRTNEGPLTPLNVRLYTQDYEVIDRLVEEFGAYSRGHLVTVSLTEFFAND